MMFRRTIVAALFVGLLAGLMLSFFQVVSVNPILFEAESFEVDTVHEHASHDHSEEAWAPEDGLERTGYTLVSNIFAGIGFAAILLSFMSQLQLQGITHLDLFKGLAWSIAGFYVFFVAPGIGLPPEIPGIEAKPVEYRQAWWLFTVVVVALGLLILAFAPLKIKAIGLVGLISPYIVTVPHHEGPAFTHPEAEAVANLTRLHQEFIIASGVSNLAFWLVLGVVSAWIINAWVLKEFNSSGEYGEPASV